MKPRSVTVSSSNQRSADGISESIQKYNPTLKNILRVEQVLAKHREFDSKAQLTKKLDITMRPPVLNIILNIWKSQTRS